MPTAASPICPTLLPSPGNSILRRLYYHIKPILPRRLQLSVRRLAVARQRRGCASVWPILPAAAARRTDGLTWPDQKQFALVLTHDVDTARGLSRCRELLQLEMQAGFRSVFNFVPEERYRVPADLRHELQAKGYEVGVHGLTHDGRLFESEHTFNERAVRINSYLSDWGAAAFRAPAMHHNLEWISRLNITHDMSTFDTDVFEPQPDGVGTIFPFVYAGAGGRYVELPYTLPQDFTLFVLMREPSIDIWIRKLDWVAENGGMALVNTHPDYMRFNGARPCYDEYPARWYQELLEHIRKHHEGRFWHALPCEVAAHVSRTTVTQTCLYDPEAYTPSSAVGGSVSA